MLAQNFKTPADLNLTDAEHSALVTVLGMMERGELTHTITTFMENVGGNLDEFGLPKFTGHFNMAAYLASYECGTVGCILGTAVLVSSNKEIFDSWDFNLNLYRLFLPSFDLDTVTVEQAAGALRSYLTTGEAVWL